MNPRIILGLLCLLFLPGIVHAGAEANVTSVATFIDGGNAWRPISVAQSTTTVVLISTTPKGSLLEIQTWRNREIVNISTCAQLVLYPNNVDYAAFSSSFSVLLSSGGSTNEPGDVYRVPHQGAVYGIWSPGDKGCGNGGWGAAGLESYYDAKKDRLPPGKQ